MKHDIDWSPLVNQLGGLAASVNAYPLHTIAWCLLFLCARSLFRRSP